MDLKLKNQVAFITDAARGQGRATALQFAQEGGHVFGFDLSEGPALPGYALGRSSDLEQLKEDIEKLGQRCEFFCGDVRRKEDVQAAAQKCQETFSRVDLLFNNAGICAYASTDEMTEEQWNQMLDINLKGTWLTTQALLPIFKAQKSGVIINNSSVGGLRGMNRLSHYAASKWGMTGLTKSWAIELAAFGIRVLSIHPTGVNTPMNDGLAAAEGLTPQQVAERSAGNLLPVPWIEPEDVASAVCFLASERSRYITGAQICLDAGLLTR